MSTGISIQIKGTAFADKNVGTQTPCADRYLSWIKGDGASYIATGVTGYRTNGSDVAGTIPSDAPRLEVTFAIDGEISGNSGVMLSSTSGNTRAVVTGSNKLNMYGKGALATNVQLVEGTQYKLTYGSVKSYLDSSEIADNTSMSNQYRLNAYSTQAIDLFKATISRSTYYSSNLKIYEFKYYEGETLVRHLKPYAKKTGKIGMYDVVSATFYANQGTGNFAFAEL